MAISSTSRTEIITLEADSGWVERLERECLRWGVSRSRVMRDALTLCVLGPNGLACLYPSAVRVDRAPKTERGASFGEE